MRIRHDTRFGGALMTGASWLLRGVVGAIGRTWRVELVEGRERLDALLDRGEPVILTFWHNRSVLALPLLLHHLHRRGFDVTVLASGSRDGELVARTVRGWGVHVVRGSATRGGREALWGTFRAIRRRGSSPVVVPDGPTGPPYVYKVGVLHLARLSGSAVLPLGLAANRYWTVGSWDRLMVPLPFARIAVVVGEPRTVARGIQGDALERERLDREAALNRLTGLAEGAAGSPGPAERPLPPGPAPVGEDVP